MRWPGRPGQRTRDQRGQPDWANWDGQTTSDVITFRCCGSGREPLGQLLERDIRVGDKLRVCTVLFACSFSEALTGAVVAVPSELRPWVFTFATGASASGLDGAIY